ncbi:MAG: hypothetical protein SFV15_16420 [Polyangiaceae bacterium]|nr:hypothetical protein [Polyangiaceae bacterium]
MRFESKLGSSVTVGVLAWSLVGCSSTDAGSRRGAESPASGGGAPLGSSGGRTNAGGGSQIATVATGGVGGGALTPGAGGAPSGTQAGGQPGLGGQGAGGSPGLGGAASGGSGSTLIPTPGNGPAVINAEAGDSTKDKRYVVKVGGIDYPLWVPGGISKIRGIVKARNEAHYTEIARLLNFACLHFDASGGAWPGVKEALKLLAVQSGHPELEFAPFLATGHSASSGALRDFVSVEPSRFIAISPGGLEVRPETPELDKLPWMVWYGSRDASQSNAHIDNLELVRPRGALFGIAPQWGGGHAFDGSANLTMVWYWESVARRYPSTLSNDTAQPALVEIEEASGWVGERNDWLPDQDGSGNFKVMTQGTRSNIAPFASAPFDKSRAVWLLGSYAAHVWRGYASPDNAVSVASPVPQHSEQKRPVTLIEPGAKLSVKLAVNYDPTKIKKVEVWDGDKPLGAVTAPDYTLSGIELPPGIHAMMGVITRTDDTTLSSQPSTVYSIRVKCPVADNVTLSTAFPINCISP